MIRRWGRQLLTLSPESPLLMLYLQIFFFLYFYRCADPDHLAVASVFFSFSLFKAFTTCFYFCCQAPNIARSGLRSFGFRLLEGNSGSRLRRDLTTRLQVWSQYWSQAVSHDQRAASPQLSPAVTQWPSVLAAMVLWYESAYFCLSELCIIIVTHSHTHFRFFSSFAQDSSSEPSKPNAEPAFLAV